MPTAPASHLQLGERRDFVRLDVRPVGEPVAGEDVLRAFDVRLDDIEIDHNRGCIEVGDHGRHEFLVSRKMRRDPASCFHVVPLRKHVSLGDNPPQLKRTEHQGGTGMTITTRRSALAALALGAAASCAPDGCECAAQIHLWLRPAAHDRLRHRGGPLRRQAQGAFRRQAVDRSISRRAARPGTGDAAEGALGRHRFRHHRDCECRDARAAGRRVLAALHLPRFRNISPRPWPIRRCRRRSAT